MFKGKNNHRQRAGRVWYYSLHAEMCALLRIIRSKDKRGSFKSKKTKKTPQYNGSVVYVARPLGNDMFGNAKPCANCAKYLHAHGITKIKYTDVRIIDGTPTSVLCEMRAC